MSGPVAGEEADWAVWPTGPTVGPGAEVNEWKREQAHIYIRPLDVVVPPKADSSYSNTFPRLLDILLALSLPPSLASS